jgi:hypothetical protein
MDRIETVSHEFFRLIGQVRRLERQRSTTDGMLALIERAATSITQDHQADALSALQGLKRCIEAAQPLLDDTGEREEKAAADYMMLRRLNLELQMTIAELRGEHRTAAERQHGINQVNAFFSAAITELDSERK